MAIKSILGGKSKNLCDLAYLLTLPVDKKFNGYGFWEVEISVEPNTTYTLSRENANHINLGGATYLGITNQYGVPNGGTPHQWLNHDTLPGLCHQNVQITSNSDGKLWVFFSSLIYKYWQKNLNPFGYIQLEKGSTATEYVPHELTSYKSIMKVSDVCQLVDKSKFTASGTRNGITWVSNGDGSITLNGTCTSGFALNPFNQSVSVDQTHFYYSSPYVSINYGGAIDGTYETGRISFVKTSAFPTKFNTVFYIWIDEGRSFSNVTTFINIDDLTEMFGAGNEPKTVAEFKAKFPNDYYPYSPSCFVTSFDERMPCKTKNLFSSSTEVGTLEGGLGGPTVTRNFEENKWYVGLTSNNYYNPGMIKEYSIKGGLIYFKRDDVNSNGYGLARAIKCEPSTTYTVSLEPIYVEKYYAFNIGYFDKNGNLVSTNNVAGITKTITTPNNCNWIVFVLNFYDEYTSGKGKAYFCNLQLEKGTTATDYVPYGYV